MAKPISNRFRRCILSFVLFLLITALSVSAVSLAVFAKSRIADAFFSSDNNSYISNARVDINEYAKDLCKKSGVDESSTNTFPSLSFEDAVAAYLSPKLGTERCWSASISYDDALADMKDTFKDSIIQSVDQSKTTENVEQCADDIAQKAVDYAKYRIEFKYADTVKSVSDKATAISVAVLVLSLIAAALMVYYIRRNSMKKTSFALCGDSLLAAGIFELALAVTFEVILQNKNLYIFPSYLCNMITNYAKTSNIFLFVSSGVLLIMGIIMAVISAKQQKIENKG